jgi:hypothetical protein
MGRRVRAAKATFEDEAIEMRSNMDEKVILLNIRPPDAHSVFTNLHVNNDLFRKLRVSNPLQTIL